MRGVTDGVDVIVHESNVAANGMAVMLKHMYTQRKLRADETQEELCRKTPCPIIKPSALFQAQEGYMNERKRGPICKVPGKDRCVDGT